MQRFSCRAFSPFQKVRTDPVRRGGGPLVVVPKSATPSGSFRMVGEFE